MERTLSIVIGVILFLIITFLYWKVTNNYAKKEYGKKMWEHWGTRTNYWTGTLFICGGLTTAIIFLLKWGNILTF